MVRRYDFITCNIFRFSSITKRGSKVEEKTLIYENIPCSFWSTSKNFSGGQLSQQSENNTHELNLKAIYEVKNGDIVELREVKYKVVDIIPHPNRKGNIDNLQIFLQATKSG